MSAFGERRKQDLKRLRDLETATGGRVRVVGTSGSPLRSVEIALRYRTAPSSGYPGETASETVVRLDLSSRYPFQEPTASFVTPVYHPNVYASGKVCLGTKWLASETLDLLVERLIKLLIFDETILNEKSPANTAALGWYRAAKRRNPTAFPSDEFTLLAPPSPQKPAMAWSNMPSDENKTARVEVRCDHCEGRLRLPTGRSGFVRCPHCKNRFRVAT